MKRGRAQWLERRRYAFPLKGITQLTQAAWFHLKSERELLDLKPTKVRVRLETAVALCAGILGVLTIFWLDWIEALTGWDPDHNNGTFEWLIVAALLAVSIVMGVVARRHWQALAAPSAR